MSDLPAACCDLGTDDPTGDEDGIYVAVCKHRLDGTFGRYWDENDDEDDAVSEDPAHPLIYVGRTKRDEADQLNQLIWHGCAEDNCPETNLCRTHFDAL